MSSGSGNYSRTDSRSQNSPIPEEPDRHLYYCSDWRFAKRAARSTMDYIDMYNDMVPVDQNVYLQPRVQSYAIIKTLPRYFPIWNKFCKVYWGLLSHYVHYQWMDQRQMDNIDKKSIWWNVTPGEVLDEIDRTMRVAATEMLGPDHPYWIDMENRITTRQLGHDQERLQSQEISTHESRPSPRRRQDERRSYMNTLSLEQQQTPTLIFSKRQNLEIRSKTCAETGPSNTRNDLAEGVETTSSTSSGGSEYTPSEVSTDATSEISLAYENINWLKKQYNK
ncbi:unnamed protein product [Amaranthus hypochondriacus]